MVGFWGLIFFGTWFRDLGLLGGTWFWGLRLLVLKKESMVLGKTKEEIFHKVGRKPRDVSYIRLVCKAMVTVTTNQSRIREIFRMYNCIYM